MAEFENFRKRTEKEKSQMFDMGAKTIVEKVLPVIDNFERGLDVYKRQASYIVINAGPQKHSQTLSKMRSNIHRMEV